MLDELNHYFNAMLLENALLSTELLAIVRALRNAGIDAIPVKGTVLAETVYGSLALRQAADIDVLVRAQDLPRARSVLHDHGWSQQPKPDFGHQHHALHDPPYFRKVAGRKINLDLHWTIWASHLFPISVEQLWERTISAELRGEVVRMLSPEDTLLHLVIHHSRAAQRLRLVCDIAEVMRRHGATLDWNYILQELRLGGGLTALYCSLVSARQLLGAPVPAGLLDDIGIGQLKRRVLHHMCGPLALFSPVGGEGGVRYPSIVKRLLLLDSGRQTARALGYRALRTARRARAEARGVIDPQDGS